MSRATTKAVRATSKAVRATTKGSVPPRRGLCLYVTVRSAKKELPALRWERAKTPVVATADHGQLDFVSEQVLAVAKIKGLEACGQVLPEEKSARPSPRARTSEQGKKLLFDSRSLSVVAAGWQTGSAAAGGTSPAAAAPQLSAVERGTGKGAPPPCLFLPGDICLLCIG